jgi:hypothetical protein
MPNYLARVVLHRTDGSDDYTDLHTEMDNRGFSQRLSNYDPRFPSSTVQLPGGTYFFDAARPMNRAKNYSLDEAYKAVQAAISTVMLDEKQYIKDYNNPPTLLVFQVDAGRWFLPVS